MYEFLLVFHSWWRWLLVLLLIFLCALSLKCWFQKSPYTSTHQRLLVALVAFAHVQLLTGLLLYAVASPITAAAFLDMKVAMKNSALRYWAVEHLISMIVVVLFIQLARTFSKRVALAAQKHKRVFIWTFLAILLLLATLPWPGRPGIERPLFRTDMGQLEGKIEV